MQKVITRVRLDLKDLKLAIDGTIIMSENLRDALDNMFDARVPTTWKKVYCKSTFFAAIYFRNFVFGDNFVAIYFYGFQKLTE